MIAVCRYTRSGSLADHQRGRFIAMEEVFSLTVAHPYVVVGMGVWETVLQVLVREDDGLPAWCPAALFDIDDQPLPRDWQFVLREGAKLSGTELWTRWVAHWGYDRLVSDERHSDALMERDAEALAVFESEYIRRTAELGQWARGFAALGEHLVSVLPGDWDLNVDRCTNELGDMFGARRRSTPAKVNTSTTTTPPHSHRQVDRQRFGRLTLLAICSAGYVFSLVVAVDVLARVGSSSARLVLGSGVVVGLVLSGYVLVVSRRDASRRWLAVPLAIVCLVGALLNFAVIGISAVVSTLGG